jgi:HEPN domain-containing protein
MNRKDLQTLANIRMREAKALYRAGEFSGAYYLVGYAVECGLKACIAKKVKRHDFPDRQQKEKDPYTHDLVRLISLAGLKESLRLMASSDITFQKNWDVTIRWTEQSRYSVFEQPESKRLMDAIMERHHGVMPWVKRHW